MGKRNKESKMADTNETTTDEAPAAKSRAIVLTLEDGTSEKRADYIRRRADEGATRSAIAKELTALQGKDVPYQIVFAATKGHAAYAKKAETVVADETSGEASESEGNLDEAA